MAKTPNANEDTNELPKQTEYKLNDADHKRCEEVALKLYAERSVVSRGATVAPVLILQCFRDAQAFLDISLAIACGEMSVEKAETRLSDASAPNLPATHPMNLISQRFVEKNGGTEEIVLGRIQAVVAFLKANPMLGKPSDGEDSPAHDKVILDEIEVKGGDAIRLNWTVPDINTARLILPPVVKERTTA